MLIIKKMSGDNSAAWVSDQLHNILGMSDATTEKFLISMAKQAKTEGDILDRLLDTDLPATQETRNFAKQLFERLAPKKLAQAASTYKQHEQEMLLKRRKNESYSLV
jgi:pre-mRNA-splicing factor ATP-dependent RNA helicase DHX16